MSDQEVSDRPEEKTQEPPDSKPHPDPLGEKPDSSEHTAGVPKRLSSQEKRDSSLRGYTGNQKRNSNLKVNSGELKKRNSGLEKRNSGLEKRNSGLEKRNSGLEKRNSGLQKRNSSKNTENILTGSTYGKGQSFNERLEQGSRRNKIEVGRISSEFVLLGLGFSEDEVKATRESISALPPLNGIFDDDELSDDVVFDDYDQVDVDKDSLRSGSEFSIRRVDSVLHRPIKAHLGNLEGWWVTSPTWRRTAVLMCVTLFILTIVNAIVAVYFLSRTDHESIDPYVCTTPACRDISNWIVSSMDTTINPCNNFYEFVCGNYESESENPLSIPEFVTFKRARADFNGDALISRILKPTPDTSEKLIPFYKACLDTRRRDARNLDIFASIVNETIGDFLENITGFDTAEGPARIIKVTGRYGIFGFQLLDFPNVAFLPPASWVQRLLRFINERPKRNSKFPEILLPNLYGKLWEHFKFLTPNMYNNSDEAAKLFWEYFNIVSRVRIDPNGIDDTNVTHVRDRISRMLNATFGGTWDLKVIQIEGRRYRQTDLNRVSLIVNRVMVNRPRIQKAVVAFYIFNLVEFFAEEFRGKTFQELRLHRILPSTRAASLVTEERHCFDSILKSLKGYAGLRLIQAFNSRTGLKAGDESFEETASDLGEETVRRMKRIFRRLLETKLRRMLSKSEAYITETYASYKNLIKINFPFQFHEHNDGDIDKTNLFDSFVVGSDHLRNVYNAAKLFQNGVFDSWRNNRISNLKRENLALEESDEFTDNFVEYENNLYPSISLFDLPFFYTDFRPFGHAGFSLFLAKSFIRLWVDNIRLLENNREGPLIFSKILDLSKWREVHNSSSLGTVRKCLGDKRFISNDTLLNSLAFKMALENLVNPRIYDSARDKKTGELIPNIESEFEPNGSVKYFNIGDNRNDSKPRKFINRSDFDPYPPQDFKLRFTKAPGLEKFTTEQVFFITSVRHHCYIKHQNSTEARGMLAADLNLALGHVTEFSQIWKCPTDSPMHRRVTCL